MHLSASCLSPISEFNVVITNFDPDRNIYGPDVLVLEKGQIIKYIKHEERGWHFGEQVDAETMTVTIASGWYSPVYVAPVSPANNLRNVTDDCKALGSDGTYLVLKRGSVIKCLTEEDGGTWHYGVWFDTVTMSPKKFWYSTESVTPYHGVKTVSSAPTDQERKEAAEDEVYLACLNHSKRKEAGNSGDGEAFCLQSRETKASSLAFRSVRKCFVCDEWCYVSEFIKCINPGCSRSRLRKCNECGQKTYIGPFRMTQELTMILRLGRKYCMNPFCRV